MKLRTSLIAAAITLGVVAQAWGHFPCAVQLLADKTYACVGDSVTVTVISTICDMPATTNLVFVPPTNGTYTVSYTCTDCDGNLGGGSIDIHAFALASISPSSATMCPGSYKTFTGLGSPGDPSFAPTWAVSPTNAGTVSVQGGTATFQLSSGYNSDTATLSASWCDVTTSATITVTMDNPLTITSQPTSQVACIGSNVTFTVSATGSNLTYQWRKDGLDLANCYRFHGATSATLTVSNVFATTSECKAIHLLGGGGTGFGSLLIGDTYTYQAWGCTPINAGLSADPAGNLYGDSNCTLLASGPGVATSDFLVPGLIAWSLVGRFQNSAGTNWIQLGANGDFQVPGTGTRSSLSMMINAYQFHTNTGSWTGCVSDAVEGVYDCIVSSDCGSQITTGATLSVSTPCDGIPDWWRLQYFGTATINDQTCTMCDDNDSGLDNLQDYQCGFDPVAVITTPPGVGQGTTNNASIPPEGDGVTYTWSVTNGTINTGQDTTNITWSPSSLGTATVCVTVSNSGSCDFSLCTTVAVVNHAYYVDYVGGNDTNSGTSPLSPWQHCHGDGGSSVGRLPLNTALNPGDTVYFKGGVQYVFTESPQGGYTPGIQLYNSGTNGAPITYTSSANWGNGSRAIFTDNYATNNYAAFWDYFGASNIVFNDLEIGPLGGSNSLPGYSDISLTTITTGEISTGTSPLSIDSGSAPVVFSVAVPGCSSFQVDNSTNFNVLITNLVFVGSYFSFGGPLPTSSNPITNFASSSVSITACLSNTPTYGSYTGAVLVYCDNGQILTNVLIGQSTVAPNPAWGLFFANGCTNVTVENCYFHSLGYWYNQQPMNADSIAGGGVSPGGITCEGALSDLVVTNCEFTQMHTGIEILYGITSSNLVVAACNFHDYIVWCIDLAGPCVNIGCDGCCNGNAGTISLNNVFINGNQFHDFDWAYSVPGGYWTGYGGPPHQDAIYDRPDSAGSGTNVYIYNNVFYGTHTNGDATAAVWLGSGSANVYGNVFDNSRSLTFPVEVSASTNTTPFALPSMMRVLNNTFIVNTTNTSLEAAILISTSGTGDVWPTNAGLDIRNNILYDWRTATAGGDVTLVDSDNGGGGTNNWVVNYNDYRELAQATLWDFGYGGIGEVGFGTMQSYGFDTSSITNNPSFLSLTYGSGTNSWGNNYGILSNSPCVGAGTSLATLTNLDLPGIGFDINGNPRTDFNNGSNIGVDIGAYQH